MQQNRSLRLSDGAVAFARRWPRNTHIAKLRTKEKPCGEYLMLWDESPAGIDVVLLSARTGDVARRELIFPSEAFEEHTVFAAFYDGGAAVGCGVEAAPRLASRLFLDVLPANA